MGKQKPADDTLDKQKNKIHKTLREKLRKKRQEQKKHLKQKKQNRKRFDPIQQKEQFFKKHLHFQNKRDGVQYQQFKYKKVKKYIQKFINVYEDDLEDFFELFKTFDEGGFIDINDLQNKKLQKILKKMFKYLPLKRTKNQFRKKQKQSTGASNLQLQPIIRNLVSQSIENYLQYGTDEEQEDNSSQDQQKNINSSGAANTSGKIPKKKVKIQNNDDQQIDTLKVTKTKQKPDNTNYNMSMGPMIPEQQREKIAKIFQQQLKKFEEQKNQQNEAQESQFDAIFGKATLSKKHVPKVRQTINSIPEHLLAQGSAQLGQKVQIDQQQLDEYNSIHRPKKLIEQHQQMLNMGKVDQFGKKQRKPFDRQRDIVNGRNRIMSNGVLKNGVFFDFKDRMSKPQGTNNFL